MVHEVIWKLSKTMLVPSVIITNLDQLDNDYCTGVILNQFQKLIIFSASVLKKFNSRVTGTCGCGYFDLSIIIITVY